MEENTISFLNHFLPQATLRRTCNYTHAQQMAMLEQSRRREEQREDTLKSLARERMEQANMGSEDRVETKRFLRRMQQENKEREMEEAILNAS